LGIASGVGEEVKKPEPAADAKPAAKTPDFTDPSKLTEKAPDTFKAQFDTTKGKFTIEVTRSLSPQGADRFYNLVRSGYFKDIAFFRVIPGFMAQFGIHGDPKVSEKWREARIQDDQVKAATPAARSLLRWAVRTRAPRSCSLISSTTPHSTEWVSRRSAKSLKGWTWWTRSTASTAKACRAA